MSYQSQSQVPIRSISSSCMASMGVAELDELRVVRSLLTLLRFQHRGPMMATHHYPELDFELRAA